VKIRAEPKDSPSNVLTRERVAMIDRFAEVFYPGWVA
jgi:hypothetical protein